MKANYEVYGVSFLDLLSGALGAVIILFVIVPKMDVSIPLDEINEIKKDKVLMDSLYASIQGNIPEEKYNMLLSLSQVAEARINAINTKHEELQRKYVQEQKKVENLRSELDKTNAKLKSTKKAIKKQRTNSKPSSSGKSAKSTSGKSNFFAGIDSELAVFLEWSSDEYDVDLYFKEGNRFCDEQLKRTDFCTFVNVPRRYKSKPSELIIQPELVPGTYQIYAHLYRPREGSVKVKGFIGMNAKNGKAYKYDLPETEITHTRPPNRSDGGTLLGTLIVKENNFEFKPKN
jgi:hypothetical protein